MISFKEDGKKFNFRVGAIIISRDKKKVLLHTIKGFGFYLLPGGRVEWLENSTTAIKRELEEELNLTDITVKPVATYENFFNFLETDFHEVANNFVIELEEKHAELEKAEKFFGVEGEKYIYEWHDIDKLDEVTLKPACLKEMIINRNGPYAFYELNDNDVDIKY